MSNDATIISGNGSQVFGEPNALKIYDWIFNEIQSYLLRPTLEMDSGFGTVSAQFASRTLPIHLSDKKKENRDRLRNRFKGIDVIDNVYRFDFGHPDFELLYTEAFGGFGSIIALNVMENGYYDPTALRNARHLLAPNGHLILIAPAYTAMFYGLEEDLDGWKRYNREALEYLLKGHFEIMKMRFLNLGSQFDNDLSKSLGLSVLAVARRL